MVRVFAPVVILLASVNEFDGLPVYGVLAGSPRKCHHEVHPELGTLSLLLVRWCAGDDRQDAVDLCVRRRDREEGAAEVRLVGLGRIDTELIGVWRQVFQDEVVGRRLV